MNINSEIVFLQGTLDKKTKVRGSVQQISGEVLANVNETKTNLLEDQLTDTINGLYQSEKVKFEAGIAYLSSTRSKYRHGFFGVLSSY